MVAVPSSLASASVVFYGRYGDVTQQARSRGVPRQTLYREAHKVLQTLEDRSKQQRLSTLQEQGTQFQQPRPPRQRSESLRVTIDKARQAQFAATASAMGVSASASHALLEVLLGPKTPSRATLARYAQHAAGLAQQALTVLDEYSRDLAHQVAADEIFTGRRPILMIAEQHSLCWLTGQLSHKRDGEHWVKEFQALPQLQQVTCDGGVGLRRGIALLNEQRTSQEQKPVATQDDHFHLLREGQRALRRMQSQAQQALAHAEEAQKALQKRMQRGFRHGGQIASVRRKWDRAQEKLDQWSAAEKAWKQVQQALSPYTEQGHLQSRATAQACIEQTLESLQSSIWDRVRRLLAREQVWTFLDRAEQRLAEVEIEEPVRRRLVQAEGLRQKLWTHPRAEEKANLNLLLSMVLAVIRWLSGASGQVASEKVRAILGDTFRSSSLVEGLNSVLRMHQRRHKRLNQPLLDLKRLWWNCHRFRTGKRKGKCPYAQLGLKMPTEDWWQLIQMTPEQLKLQLSELNGSV